MKSYLLGLDVGTGGTRAVLVGGDGRIVSSATREHQPFASAHHGWAEQDPHDWWNAAANAVRHCITKAQLGGQDIACVGLAGQMHGAVLLDADDQVLRPAIIWCDQRTERECDWLDHTVGHQRLVQLSCPVGDANVISLIKKRPKVISRKTFHLFQRPTYSAARADVFVSYTVSDAAPAGANSRFSVLITLLSALQDRARLLTWRPFLQCVFCTVKIDPLPEERAEFSSSAWTEKN